MPWLDLELVRWSLTLPDSVLIRSQRAKWLPKELAARWSPHRWPGEPSAALPRQLSAWRQDGHPAAGVSARDGTLRWPHPSLSSMARCQPAACRYLMASIRSSNPSPGNRRMSGHGQTRLASARSRPAHGGILTAIRASLRQRTGPAPSPGTSPRAAAGFTPESNA